MKKSEKRKQGIFSVCTIILFFIVSFIFFGCYLIRPGTSGSAKPLYETFYVGNEGIQYFIKPLKFKGEKYENIYIDIVFRHKDEFKDSATINISIFTQDPFLGLNKIDFENDSILVNSSDIKILFTEKHDKGNHLRVAVKIPTISLNNLFKNISWKINVFKNSSKYEFITDKSVRNDLSKLREAIFP